MKSLSQTVKSIPPQVWLYGAGAVAVYYLFRANPIAKVFTPGPEVAKEASAHKSDTQAALIKGITASYSDTVYYNLAGRINSAGQAFFGTDEAAILAVFEQLRNDVDFYKLAEAFGQRRLEFSLSWGGLTEYLQSELGAKEMAKLNAIMAKNGLTIRV